MNGHIHGGLRSWSALVGIALVTSLGAASSARAGFNAPPVPVTRFARSFQQQLTLEDPSTSTSRTYDTTSESDVRFLSAMATTSGSIWGYYTGGDEAGNHDYLRVQYAVTGTSALPSFGSITTIGIVGNVLSLNTTTRTFASSTEAREFARALVAAAGLPGGVSLGQDGGKLMLTVELEQSWIGY